MIPPGSGRPGRSPNTQREHPMEKALVKSQALFERASRVIVGGVNSPVRAFKSVGGTPPFIARGAGAYLFDADGNRYIDYVLSWGPLILGHAREEVVAAATEAIGRGSSFGAPTEQEVELAEMILSFFPGMEGAWRPLLQPGRFND